MIAVVIFVAIGLLILVSLMAVELARAAGRTPPRR